MEFSANYNLKYTKVHAWKEFNLEAFWIDEILKARKWQQSRCDLLSSYYVTLINTI